MKRKYLILFLLTIFPFVLNSQNKSDKLIKAQSLMEAENYLEADKLFDEIIISNPDKLDVLYNAAYCKLYVGRPDVAINYLKKFLMKNQNYAEVYNLLGLAYEKTGYNAEAIEQFSNAIKKEKNFYEAHFNRGRIYLSLDSVELAKKDFNYAKKNKIINPELYFSSGNLYSLYGKYDSALIDLNKILKYKTDDPYYLSLLADAYFATADNDTVKLEKAIEYYTKSLQLDSENVNVLKNRSFVYDKLDQTDKGEADKNKILQIQQKTDINPSSIKYRRLASADNSFYIDIPELWRTLVSKTNDSDVVIFFDTNFANSQQNGFYIYDFGGRISYYPNYFKADLTDTVATLQVRLTKFAEYIEQQNKINNSTLKNYVETIKKTFNPNGQLIRNLIKYTFYSENNKKYFGVEYVCITTDGKLIHIRFWIPNENSFFYERLLDYIYESLAIKE